VGEQENLLERLSSIEHGPCNDCGALDWSRCNIDEARGGFHQCNKCHVFNEETQKLERKVDA
jgi:hypothetical protein